MWPTWTVLRLRGRVHIFVSRFTQLKCFQRHIRCWFTVYSTQSDRRKHNHMWSDCAVEIQVCVRRPLVSDSVRSWKLSRRILPGWMPYAAWLNTYILLFSLLNLMFTFYTPVYMLVYIFVSLRFCIETCSVLLVVYIFLYWFIHACLY